MNATLSTAGTIKAVARKEWDVLSGGKSIYVSYPYLAATECELPFEPFYLLVRDAEDRLLGALPAYAPHGLAPWDYDYFARFIAPIEDGVAERDEWFPIMLGGTGAGYVNELLVHPHLTEAQRQEVTRTLLQALLCLAEGRDARSVGLMYLTSHAASQAEPFLGDRAMVLWSGADTRLDIEWATFESYLAWLSSSRRRTVRRELERFATSGLSVSVGRLGDWFEEIAPLTDNLTRRYGVPSDVPRWTQYFACHAAELHDTSTLYLCHSGSRLVGYSLLYEWEGVVYVRACGFDYERAGANAEYFNLAYYLPIKHAIERQASHMYFGLDSYEAKVLRGAKLVPLWTAVVGPEAPTWDWKSCLSSRNKEKVAATEGWLGSLSIEGLWAESAAPYGR